MAVQKLGKKHLKNKNIIDSQSNPMKSNATMKCNANVIVETKIFMIDLIEDGKHK